MHEAVTDYVSANAPSARRVLEFGSRDINGSVREVVTSERYVGVDVVDGPLVDVVGDASTVELGELFDLVVSTEVLEHVDDDTAEGICANAWRHLDADGLFVATMAGIGRHEHSAIDGGHLKSGEFYRNVDAATLAGWLAQAGFRKFSIDIAGRDIRCTARKD